MWCPAEKHSPVPRRARRAVRGPVLLSLALAALLAVGHSEPAPALSAHQAGRSAPLGHSGQFLTDAAGQVVTLHGLNMVSKVAPYEPAAAGFGTAAAQSLAANGFNVVRLGIIYSALEPEPGVFSASYVASIKHTVATLARAGVYSLLDFHQDQLNAEFGGEGFPAWSLETDGLPIAAF